MKPFTKKIVLESGREFYGYGFGADREAPRILPRTFRNTAAARTSENDAAAARGRRIYGLPNTMFPASNVIFSGSAPRKPSPT